MDGRSYTLPLAVRMTDLDIRGQVSNASLLRFLQESAIQDSADLGFTPRWYEEHGQFWVIRTMRLERSAPAFFDDNLEIITWVSSMTRVRADRNYSVRRAPDGCLLARATANWVYLDSKTMYPARIAPDIIRMYASSNPPALPPRDPPRWLRPPSVDLNGVTTRRAQFYEADSARHINNAIYVDWLEEAVRDVLPAHGLALPPDGSPSLWFHRRFIEYFDPAKPGDELEIQTRLVGVGRSAGRWAQEIRRPASGARIVESECTTVWCSESGLMPWRDVMPIS